MEKYLIGILFSFSVAISACSPKISEVTVKPDEERNETAAMSAEVISGKQIYENKCVGCHDWKKIKSYSPSEWATILPTMIEYAKLNEPESANITAFVNWKLESD